MPAAEKLPRAAAVLAARGIPPMDEVEILARIAEAMREEHIQNAAAWTAFVIAIADGFAAEQSAAQ